MADTTDFTRSNSRQDAARDARAEDAPRPKLPLSKIIYGFGMSARDAGITFMASTAAFTAALYFGGKKAPILQDIAKFPEWLGKQLSSRIGPKSGNLKNSLTMAIGLATVVSYIAHVPGLLRGPKKVEEAERMFDAQVDNGRKLARQNTLLEEDNARLQAALEEAKSNASAISRLQSQSAGPVSRSA